MLISERLK